MRSQINSFSRRAASTIARFASNERGTTAIEFAAVIGPFLFLLFGIMSVGFYFFVVFSLENAVDSAARVIRTGQEQTTWTGAVGNTKQDQFKTLVCAKVPDFMNCNGSGNKVRVNVQTFTGYGSIAAASCVDGSGNLITSTAQSYDTGTSNSIVLVSVCFEWSIGTAMANIPYWISPANAQMANGNTLIKASVAFTNEPYN